MKRALDGFKGDERIETPLYHSGALANLGGQIHVRLVEMHGRAHLLSHVALDHGAYAGLPRLGSFRLDDTPAFLTMPFDEAVRFWTERGGDPELLQTVLRAYSADAAARGDATLDGISQRAVDGITATLERGGTLDDFISAVRDGGTDEVVAPISDDYLDLVFRTQVAGSYGAGRYKQLSDPDVIAARPYRQGRTAEDARVRDEHAPIDGIVWLATNDAFGNVAAPFGFRCRCQTVSGDEEDFASWGGVLTDAPPSDFVITPGFGAAAFAL